MGNFATRVGIGGALLLCLSQVGGEAAVAQQYGGGGRYGAIGRDAESVLLLDQQDGIIYRCPTNYVSRCHRQSSVS